MYYLENVELKVSVLDPHSTADQKRLGPRFCTGNYIWQVEKKDAGPLLSGPCYPDPTPPVSDGQGLPEVFQPMVPEDTPDGTPVTIIGVGKVAYHHDIHIMRKKESVLRFCEWEADCSDQAIQMVTHQHIGGNPFDLIRIVQLDERVLTIKTTIRNTGEEAFSFRWFAHPFYQLVSSSVRCKLYVDADMAANPGFMLSKDQQISMKQDYDWERGYYQTLDDVEGKHLKASISHPSSSDITMSGDFPLKKVALWANANTFSIEPFFEKRVEPSGSVSWQLAYTF